MLARQVKQLEHIIELIDAFGRIVPAPLGPNLYGVEPLGREQRQIPIPVLLHGRWRPVILRTHDEGQLFHLGLPPSLDT